MATRLAVGVVAFAAAGSASAQSDGAKAAARELDAAAIQLQKSGALREAVAALRKSFELAPKPATLKRIASVLHDLHDFAVERKTYEELEGELGDKLSAREKKDIAKKLDALAAITAVVKVKPTQEGVAVTVDGKDAGASPSEIAVRVNFGSHVVAAQKRGYLPFETKVDAEASGDVVVPVELVALPAHLVVRTRHAARNVTIDGRDRGEPPWEGDVAPGQHTVTAAGETKTIDVQPGESGAVELEGETVGEVEIESEPSGAGVEVDGAPRGVTPWIAKLPVGRHDVTVGAKDHVVQSFEVNVRADERAKRRVTLADALPPVRAPSSSGFYAEIGAMLSYAPSTEGLVADGCALSPTSCSGDSSALGGGLPLRMGYSLGWLGIEGVHIARFTSTSETQFGPNGQSDAFSIYRLALANGVGLRFMPPTQIARFTAGVALTWLHEFAFVGVDGKKAAGLSTTTVDGDAPMLSFDAGVMFGRTPGVKLKLGVDMSFEFWNKLAPSDEPTLDFVRGTTFFVGPEIGLQLGH